MRIPEGVNKFSLKTNKISFYPRLSPGRLVASSQNAEWWVGRTRPRIQHSWAPSPALAVWPCAGQLPPGTSPWLPGLWNWAGPLSCSVLGLGSGLLKSHLAACPQGIGDE